MPALTTPVTDQLSDLTNEQRAWLEVRHQLYLLSRFGTRHQQSALAGMEDPYQSRQTLEDQLQQFEAASQVQMAPLGTSRGRRRSRSKSLLRPSDNIPSRSSSWCEQDFTITGGESQLESTLDTLPASPSLGCRMDIDRIWAEPLWQGLLFASLVMTLLFGSVWWWMHRKVRRREAMNEKRYTRVA